MLHNPTGIWQQPHLTMTKHAYRASNLANGDVNLVGAFDQTWSISHGSLTVITFEFACNSIYYFGETLEQESFSSRHFRCISSLVCGRISEKIYRLSRTLSFPAQFHECQNLPSIIFLVFLKHCRRPSTQTQGTEHACTISFIAALGNLHALTKLHLPWIELNMC